MEKNLAEIRWNLSHIMEPVNVQYKSKYTENLFYSISTYERLFLLLYSTPFRLREIDVNETYVMHDGMKIFILLIAYTQKYSLKQCHCIKIDIMKSRNFSPYSTSITFCYYNKHFFLSTAT